MASNLSINLVDERSAWSQLGHWLLVLVFCGAALAVSVDLAGFTASARTFIAGVVSAICIEYLIGAYVLAKSLNERRGLFSKLRKFLIGSSVACGLLAAWNLIAPSLPAFPLGSVASVAGAVVGAAGVLLLNPSRINGHICAAEPDLDADADAEDAGELQGDKLELAAVHEAGHAVALGIVPESVLDGCFVTMKKTKEIFTATPVLAGESGSNVMLRAEMFIFLAGPVASNRHFGAKMEGAGNDLTQWRRRARAVLDAEAPAGWVHDPESELEFERNELLLHQLQAEQQGALESFLELNERPYQELCHLLREERYASSEDLKRILASVQLCPKTLETLKVA